MVWYGRVERPTYIDDFTRHVTQPTRHSTEGQWLANRVKGNTTRISSLKGKENNARTKFLLHIEPRRPQMQKRSEK